MRDLLMTHEPITVVCNRVADGLAHVPDATITQCTQCHADVWIAPGTLNAMLRFITDGEITQIWCLRCVGGIDVLAKEAEAGNLEIQPEQREELSQGLQAIIDARRAGN